MPRESARDVAEAKSLEALLLGGGPTNGEAELEAARRRERAARAIAPPALPPPKAAQAALPAVPSPAHAALSGTLEASDPLAGFESDGSFDLFAEGSDAEDGGAGSPARGPGTAASAAAAAPAVAPVAAAAAQGVSLAGESGAGSAAASASLDVDAEVTDDSEGYMQLRPGDVVGTGGRFVVARVAGKGVFASVAICEDRTGPSAAADRAEDAVELSTVEAIPGSAGSTVAIKVARANDVMRKTAMKEAGILASLAAADRQDRCHVVRLRGYFEWRRHLCLVFEAMQLNLREVSRAAELWCVCCAALGRWLFAS